MFRRANCTHFCPGPSLQHARTISSPVNGQENGSCTSALRIMSSLVLPLLRTELFPHDMTKYSFLPHFRLITDFFWHMGFLPNCFPELLTGVFRTCSRWKVKMDWLLDSCRWWILSGILQEHPAFETLCFSEKWGTIFLQNDTVSSQMMIVLIHHNENLSSCSSKLCTMTDFVPSTMFVFCILVWLYSSEVMGGENALFKYA
jgi:hypothetical protein